MRDYKTRSERKQAEEAKQLSQNITSNLDSLNQEIPTQASMRPTAEEPPQKMMEDTSDDRMVQGTFWMTFGSIFSRLLGALYVIPWNAMLGASSEIGNALFAIGYTPYQFFLSIGIAGFPSAMSKQIAQYNAKKQYRAGQKLFKKSMGFMLLTGIVSSVLMYVFAPIIAEYSPGVSVADSTLVIRSLAPALLVVPGMSLIRGYFQGYQNMVPSAITQVVEQVARVVYILLATYIVMQVFDGPIATAVAHSTFAAFIGAAVSLVMLVWYYQKHMKKFQAVLDADTQEVTLEAGDAIKAMVKESIPFIIIGSGITFGKMIDQFTFEPIMLAATEYDVETIGQLYSLFSFRADKLIMIIISLAVGMSATSIPLLVENYIKKDLTTLGNQIRKIMELFAFVMFPAALGMMVVARPIYHVFYDVTDLTNEGVKILAIASIMSIILGGFTIVASILQSFGKHTTAILHLSIGLAVKLILQYPFIQLFETSGAVYATSVAFLVTTVLSLIKVYQLVPFNVKATAKNFLLILLITGWMAATAHITQLLLGLFISPERKLFALLIVLIIAAVGGGVYIYLALKTRIADEVLGERVGGLRRRLKIS